MFINIHILNTICRFVCVFLIGASLSGTVLFYNSKFEYKNQHKCNKNNSNTVCIVCRAVAPLQQWLANDKFMMYIVPR